MADEITYQFQIQLRNGTLLDSYNNSTLYANQAAAHLVRNVQQIPFGIGNHVVLDLGDVASPGWAMFSNLDSTNFVQVGLDVTGTFYPLLQLELGEQQLVRLAGVTPYALADTAAVELFYIIYDT